jgi:hypothetical protein
LLELEDCQEALYSPSAGEREEEPSFCRGRSYRRSSGQIALCAQGLRKESGSNESFKDSRRKLRKASAFMHEVVTARRVETKDLPLKESE